ncbi:hypothetical protein OIU84_007857 [Salix udensis]|uniref:Protein NRDE2 homolog n=1 Tax=Salix udensis TaxID=889485 RepID=A0AAD6NZV1_9ROSI|nr:hypothetical protein OIU84_007857 [Salix udensis]
MEREEKEAAKTSSSPSLFPLFEAAKTASSPSLFPLFEAASSSITQQHTNAPTNDTVPPPAWLYNTSFTTDLSIVNDAVSSLLPPHHSDSDLEEDKEDRVSNQGKDRSYELLQEPEEEKKREAKYSRSDSDHSDSGRERKKTKKRRHSKNKKRDRSRDEDARDFGSRKSNVRVWAGSDTKTTKDYYFDTHGDRDNLVYGTPYRMDVPRYKPYNSKKLNFQGLYLLNKRGRGFDRDGDIDALDTQLKSGGRYWSSKYAAVERHKNLKRLRVLARKKPRVVVSDEFIPLSDMDMSHDGGDHPGSDLKDCLVVEESWEDEVLRKTREFNKLTREHPHDEKIWLDFAEFQDKVSSMQPQKGARLQILEKKISVLEKATELNPDNEELLLCLMKAYQSRDSSDMLIGRWEKVLMHHSGNHKLWKEYLRVVQGEFSRFKVSDMRKMYAHAIQAVSSACSRQFRQVYQNEKPSSLDPIIVQQEIGLVDIFLSLCRLEWQAGYQELATALFQAEIEFTVFCPSLLLTEHSKLRLFEHFWNSDGPRVGEEGAVGWSTWLEKEEENRQRILKEEASLDEDRGGWTGWSELLSKHEETAKNQENVVHNEVTADEFLEESENEDIKQEDDAEALLKQLGIDVDAEPSSEVKDSSTWARWSKEESLRDCNQWMPVHGRISPSSGTPDGEADEHLLRAVLFEDVSEYLFSLNSQEARLSLVSQFIEFFGGDLSQWICTNSSSWKDKLLSIEVLPDPISKNLRSIHNILDISEGSSSSNIFELLLGNTSNSSKRTDAMKFLRNAVLLCLTAFPRNHILEEAALVAEEFSVTKLDSTTPCRVLAKSLLKNDRQDVLLCGVYARREAVFGNIGHARRVFDLALTSVEGLPPDLRSNAPLLYFWYAETELANSSGNNQESPSRALHILSCLGNGVAYKPFESKPSSLQLLRAHQGFKDRLNIVRSAWVRGVVDDQSLALTCSAALFEELTNGWAAGITVLDEAFTMVLPDRRCHSYQLEFLFNYSVRMLLRYHKQSSLSKVWDCILKGLQIYPSSPELFKALLEISHLYTTPNKVRWMFDDYFQKKPSVILWLFTLSFEMSRGSSQHRIHGLFERALENERLSSSVILWRLYIAYEIDIACNPSAAKRAFFRAIHACPWSKKLWLDGFLKLNSILTVKELSDLQDVMRDKELNLRTDIYEILLQDEFVS